MGDAPSVRLLRRLVHLTNSVNTGQSLSARQAALAKRVRLRTPDKIIPLDTDEDWERETARSELLRARWQRDTFAIPIPDVVQKHAERLCDLVSPHTLGADFYAAHAHELTSVLERMGALQNAKFELCLLLKGTHDPREVMVWSMWMAQDTYGEIVSRTLAELLQCMLTLREILRGARHKDLDAAVECAVRETRAVVERMNRDGPSQQELERLITIRQDLQRQRLLHPGPERIDEAQEEDECVALLPTHRVHGRIDLCLRAITA